MFAICICRMSLWPAILWMLNHGLYHLKNVFWYTDIWQYFPFRWGKRGGATCACAHAHTLRDKPISNITQWTLTNIFLLAVLRLRKHLCYFSTAEYVHYHYRIGTWNACSYIHSVKVSFMRAPHINAEGKCYDNTELTKLCHINYQL